MYYVLGTPGQKYGPADVATLRQWVAEGRLAPASMLEDATTGQTFTAQSLPGLFDGQAGPPPAPYGGQPNVTGTAQMPYSPVAGTTQVPYSPVGGAHPQQPYSPVAGSGQIHPANIDPKTGAPYQSPYVRYDSTRDYSRTTSMATAALVLIILSFACCVTGSFYSIGAAVGALVCSLQVKNAGHEKGKLYVSLSIVALVMNAIMFVVGMFLDISSLWSSFR